MPNLSLARKLAIMTLLTFLVSGCATEGGMSRWGQCALIGGGTGGILGAIESTSAAAGAAAAGAILGGLICALYPNSDSDNDGVTDKNDHCPGTPAGIAVDEHGCPLDRDNDGVPDHQDLCPGTRPGTEVNQQGCPDSDGDGVADNVDECPGTPEGAQVDDKGCPINSDGDKVPDGIDQCPNTPMGVPVDKVGCPLNVGDKLGEVHFAFDKSALRDNARQQLVALANQYKSQYRSLEPAERPMLKIVGYTDITGPEAYNEGLCLRRANSVKDFLIEQGIANSKLKTVSGGGYQGT